MYGLIWLSGWLVSSFIYLVLFYSGRKITPEVGEPFDAFVISLVWPILLCWHLFNWFFMIPAKKLGEKFRKG